MFSLRKARSAQGIGRGGDLNAKSEGGEARGGAAHPSSTAGGSGRWFTLSNDRADLSLGEPGFGALDVAGRIGAGVAPTGGPGEAVVFACSGGRSDIGHGLAGWVTGFVQGVRDSGID
jgi:hypothetical protein